MKPQDVVVALALAVELEHPTYADLAERVGLSTSQCHQSVGRLQEARLVNQKRQVRRQALFDFICHAVPAVFPAVPGEPTIGTLTGIGALGGPDSGYPLVWPDPDGTHRGLSIQPLHPDLTRMPRPTPDLLRQALAAVDAIRLSDARAAAAAAVHLQRALGLQVREAGVVDVSSSEALRTIFSESRISRSVAKWRNEPWIETELARHPLERAILFQFGDELTSRLAERVSRFDWRPQAAKHLLLNKKPPTSATTQSRTLSWPGLVDRLVARRLIDDLEPRAMDPSDDRVFSGRQFANSLAERGHYSRWFGAWQDFLAATAEVNTGLTVVLKSDVEAFFPSIDETLARAALARETQAHSDVVDLVFECLDAWRPRAGYHRVGGLPQDPVGLSHLVAQCVLRPVDRALPDTYDRKYRRFVDDIVVFVPADEAAFDTQRQLEDALARLGLRPNADKGEVLDTHTYLESRNTAAFAQIGDLVREKDSEGLVSLTRQLERRQKLDGALWRRLYSAHGQLGTRHLDDDLSEHLKDPSVRQHALKYVASSALNTKRWHALLETWKACTDGVGGLQIAQTLGVLSITDPQLGERVVAWAKGEVRPRPGDPVGMAQARGHLLLVLLRFAPEQLRRALLMLGNEPHDLAFEHYLDLASVGLGEPVPARLLDPWSDHGLSLRLLRAAQEQPEQIAAHGVVLAAALGRFGLGGGGVLPAEGLPLLRALHRGYSLTGSSPIGKSEAYFQSLLLKSIEGVDSGDIAVANHRDLQMSGF